MESTSSRFVEENISHLVNSKYSEKTKQNTKYAENLLREYLAIKQVNLDNMNEEQIDKILQGFYSSVKKKNGEKFNSTSFSGLRYAIYRFLQETKNMDIIKNAAFSPSTEIFKCVMSMLKREGKGTVQHYQVIPEEDMLKISNLSLDIPVQLQWKVWVIIQFQFAQRGMENIHAMLKTDIKITKDKSEKKVVRLRDFLTKNHRGGDLTKSTEACIYETKTSDCPVLVIEKYLEHLHPDCDYLWQRPLQMFTDDRKNWYANAKVGHNSISTMMKRISEFLNLSQSFTNHCLRSTAITVLGKKFQDTDVRSVSGHKTLVALGIYKRTSNDTLADMSHTLHHYMTKKPRLHETTDHENLLIPQIQEDMQLNQIDACVQSKNDHVPQPIQNHGVVKDTDLSNSEWNNLKIGDSSKPATSQCPLVTQLPSGFTHSILAPQFINCSNIQIHYHINK
jgi:hypothetical protein